MTTTPLPTASASPAGSTSAASTSPSTCPGASPAPRAACSAPSGGLHPDGAARAAVHPRRLVGRAPRVGDLVVCTGHAHVGPRAAIVADLLDEDRPGLEALDLGPLRLLGHCVRGESS